MPRAKVLVVDDEKPILQSTCMILETMGFEVLATSDPAEVPVLAARERPDVLLQDVRMPGLDLPSLVRRLRQEGHKMRIVLFSAAMDLDLVAEDLAVDAFIEKPFTPMDLELAVA